MFAMPSGFKPEEIIAAIKKQMIQKHIFVYEGLK